jgi:hypothetical protein
MYLVFLSIKKYIAKTIPEQFFWTGTVTWKFSFYRDLKPKRLKNTVLGDRVKQYIHMRLPSEKNTKKALVTKQDVSEGRNTGLNSAIISHKTIISTMISAFLLMTRDACLRLLCLQCSLIRRSIYAYVYFHYALTPLRIAFLTSFKIQTSLINCNYRDYFRTRCLYDHSNRMITITAWIQLVFITNEISRNSQTWLCWTIWNHASQTRAVRYNRVWMH